MDIKFISYRYYKVEYRRPFFLIQYSRLSLNLPVKKKSLKNFKERNCLYKLLKLKYQPKARFIINRITYISILTYYKQND